MKNKLKRFFARLAGWLHWLMVPPFCLFLYIAFKGLTYFVGIRYEGEESLIPLIVEIGVEGILAAALLTVIAYTLAPAGKLWAAFIAALLCVALNGYLIWQSMKDPAGAAPLWKMGTIAGLSFISSLFAWIELRRYKKRKLDQEALAKAKAESEEKSEGGASGAKTKQSKKAG